MRYLAASAILTLTLTSAGCTSPVDSKGPSSSPAVAQDAPTQTATVPPVEPVDTAAPSQPESSDNTEVLEDALVAAALAETALKQVAESGTPSQPVAAGQWAKMDFSTESDGLTVLFGKLDGKWVVVDAGTFDVGCPFLTPQESQALDLLCS